MNPKATVYVRMCKRCGKTFNTKAKGMVVVCDSCNIRMKTKSKYISNQAK